MDSVFIYRQPENEQRVSNLIWKAVKEHYIGNVDPENPSLMAKRIYDICRTIYDELDADLDKQYESAFARKDEEMDKLENEIRQLKGLPPFPTTAIG